MRVSDIVAGPLRDFSVYANTRSLPSMIDGLKVPQRKALYGVLHLGKMTTVARLASHASEVTSYKHGEENMADTITKMAQNFPGSNNLPLFESAGQFGNKFDPKGVSAPRYIKAAIHPKNYQMLFSKDDDQLLEWLFQEEQAVEPEYYLPVLPLAVINGASGIGVGYATDILPHALKDVRRAVEEVIKTGKVQTPLVPYLEGYSGPVLRLPNNQIEIRGVVERIDRTTIKIVEVPPGMDRKKYREHLNKLMKEDFDKNGNKWVRSYTNQSGEKNGWSFTLKVPMAVAGLSEDKLLDKLKLIYRNTQNLVAWDTEGKIKTYESAEALVEEFVPFRLGKYQARKDAMLDALQEEYSLNDLRIKFIDYWNEHGGRLCKLSKAELYSDVSTALSVGPLYMEKLLNMQIYSLTKDRRDSLALTNEKLYASLQELQAKTPEQIWKADLKKIA